MNSTLRLQHPLRNFEGISLVMLKLVIMVARRGHAIAMSNQPRLGNHCDPPRDCDAYLPNFMQS